MSKAQGEARAVLTVLEHEGCRRPRAICEQILACTDLTQLDTLLRRAITAATTGEVIQP